MKGGRVLDALAGCRTVAFDKTGTLTTGSLVCTAMAPLNPKPLASSGGGGGGGSRDGRASNGAAAAGAGEAMPAGSGGAGQRGALLAAVALSQRSSHPVSEAVVLMGEREGLDTGGLSVSDFRLVAGGSGREW